MQIKCTDSIIFKRLVIFQGSIKKTVLLSPVDKKYIFFHFPI